MSEQEFLKTLEDTLWASANKLRGTISSSDYEDIVLGLYFLGKFALNEGKGGGEFYTSKSIVTLIVEMLLPKLIN